MTQVDQLSLPATVFIVDDDEACRDSTRELVCANGMAAQTFASASAFLQAFDLARPGCLVLDLRMPQMDGLELQAHLIGIGARIPIVFTSGHSNIAIAMKAIRNGAVDFVQKPYHDSRLLDAIWEALRRDRTGRSSAMEFQVVPSSIATVGTAGADESGRMPIWDAAWRRGDKDMRRR
jgi:FixJ family two-component response regulator